MHPGEKESSWSCYRGQPSLLAKQSVYMAADCRGAHADLQWCKGKESRKGRNVKGNDTPLAVEVKTQPWHCSS